MPNELDAVHEIAKQTRHHTFDALTMDEHVDLVRAVLAALPEREGLREQQPVVLRDAHKRIAGTVVSRMILNFYRAFEGTYGRDVMESNLCAVGPLQSMIGLAIINGQLTATPAERGVEEPHGWIVGNGNGDRWRYIDQGLWGWTEDREKAVRYARRVDAEQAHAEDEDVWRVQPFGAAPPPPTGMVLMPRKLPPNMANVLINASSKHTIVAVDDVWELLVQLAAATGQPAQGDGT